MRLAQSGTGRDLGLPAVDLDRERADERTHVPHYARGPRARHETTREMTMRFFTLLFVLFSGIAESQYPSKPVRVVIHFPAGGSTDLVARVLSQALSESLGQPFVVENRTGADGVIAAAAVMQSPPDGNTLFIATNTAMLQVPLLQKKPPYDPLTSFTPVSLVGRYTFLLVVTPSLGVNTFNEFIAYARRNPGKINFSTYSGASQLAYAQIVKNAGVDMLRVPYKGEAPL